MAIGVVAFNSLPEPKDFANTEIITKPFFDFVARKIWIPVLVQQATFGREQRARSVYVDGAALENHMWIKNRGLENFGDACWHDFIEIERGIFISPCVVIPIDDREFWLGCAREKNGAMIAAPRFVGWNAMK